MESARSWGLNRAIFYAAAKRGFKGKPGAPSATGGPAATAHEYVLGDEKAFVQVSEPDPIFTIGGKTQTDKDFEKQICSRFGGNFDVAWQEALDYVQHFDRETLSSAQEFFSSVYRPKRDEFAARWSNLAVGDPESKMVRPPNRKSS